MAGSRAVRSRRNAGTGSSGRRPSRTSTACRSSPSRSEGSPPSPPAPQPLPREIELSRATVFELSEADRAVGALAGLGARLPNPHLLIQPYLRREAVASTRIEGTQSSLSDVLSAEAQLLVETEDQREVLNYVRAFEHGLNRLSSLPLSKRLIREMHAELLAGVRGEGATPGEFRRSQNWLGGTNPSNALFVPPPVDLLQ